MLGENLKCRECGYRKHLCACGESEKVVKILDDLEQRERTMNAIELIRAERNRQVESEGWSEQHDDSHDDGELARAAAGYAMPESWRTYMIDYERLGEGEYYIPEAWPWLHDWWKPTPDDRIRELVKAGALIAAEIERLQRKAR